MPRVAASRPGGAPQGGAVSTGFAWTVPAVIVSVVDGDTFHLDLDLGWHVHLQARVRIARINAPELATEAGKAARAFAQALAGEATGALFTGRGFDKWGRPLGDLLIRTGRTLAYDYADAAVRAGHAVAMGTTTSAKS